MIYGILFLINSSEIRLEYKYIKDIRFSDIKLYLLNKILDEILYTNL